MANYLVTKLSEKIDIFAINNLLKLYQPIVGSNAAFLYTNLVMLNYDFDNSRKKINTQDFLKLINFDNKEFYDALKKLISANLIEMLHKEENNNFIFLLKISKPLDEKTFLKNELLLNQLLINNNYIYEQILKKIDDENIQEKDYKISSIDVKFINQKFVKHENDDFNYELIANNLKIVINENIKNLINMLRFQYNLQETKIYHFLKLLNENKVPLTKEEAIKYIDNFLTEDKKQFDVKKVELNNKDDYFNYFQVISPYELITNKKDRLPTIQEKNIIDKLINDYHFTISLINLLLYYTLTHATSGYLNENFVIKIAQDWQRQKIKNLEDAYTYVQTRNAHKNKLAKKREDKKIDIENNEKIIVSSEIEQSDFEKTQNLIDSIKIQNKDL